MGETQQITHTFRKRELVLFVENANKPEFSDYIPFEAIQAGCEALDPLSKGDRVKISFFINGRLWKEGTADEKAFSSLSIKNVEVLEAARNSGVAGYTNRTAPASGPGNDNYSDDLPF